MHTSRVLRLVGVVWVVLVLGLSAYGFYKNTHKPHTPYDAFWGALSTLMTTDGITCTVHDNTAGRDSVQAVSLDLVTKTDATSKTTIKQNGSSVKTEGISTASDDYVRYTDIQLDTQNKNLNFSKVLNVWGKQAHGSDTSLFAQTALGGCVVPLARLTDSQAAGLLADMKKNQVFQTDYNRPTKASDDGVAVLRYTATVPPENYVPFMKRFAGVYGLRALNAVNTSSYSGQAPKSIHIDVSSDNDRLYRISFTGQNHSIQFSDYGKRPHISIPDKTIPMTELQQRLQAVK